MAQTTPRESLTCVAISYVAKEGNRSNIDQFSQAVEKYYFENDSNGINSRDKVCFFNSRSTSKNTDCTFFIFLCNT